MAKKAAKKKTNAVNLQDTVELRRWCIEMAVRWPVHDRAGYSQMGGGGFQSPTHEDEDVIGRAEKLIDWVLNAEGFVE